MYKSRNQILCTNVIQRVLYVKYEVSLSYTVEMGQKLYALIIWSISLEIWS